MFSLYVMYDSHRMTLDNVQFMGIYGTFFGVIKWGYTSQLSIFHLHWVWNIFENTILLPQPVCLWQWRHAVFHKKQNKSE